MKLSVYNTEGKETSKSVTLSKDIFGIEPNDHAVYLDVKHFLAAQRQGTHKSKERSDVSGSRRKLRKQKGSGAARVGDINNPLFRGGGRVFGPRPRDYNFKLNKKVKQLARRSALSKKVQGEAITIIENFTFELPRTKTFQDVLAALGLNNKKSLFIVGDYDKNIYLSSRNLTGVKVVNSSELSTYDIMNATTVVMSQGAVEKITAILS